MTNLKDLLTRVEGATVDNEHVVLYDAIQLLAHDETFRLRLEAMRRVQAYESAALALVSRVLPGLPWMVQTAPEGTYYAHLYQRDPVDWAYGKTPALALLAAMLKALLANPGSEA